MNTVQMYAGKGNNVPPTPQTAKSVPQLSFLADNRPTNLEIRRLVCESQAALLSVVDSYMERESPIEAINTFLEHWLATPPADLNSKHTHLALKLVNFLTELRDSNDAIRINTNAVESKEVGNG